MSHIQEIIRNSFLLVDSYGEELFSGNSAIQSLGKLGEDLPLGSFTMGLDPYGVAELSADPKIVDVTVYHQGRSVKPSSRFLVSPRQINETEQRDHIKMFSFPTKGENSFDVVVLQNDGSFVWVQNSIQTQSHLSGIHSSLNNAFALSQVMFVGKVVSHQGQYIIVPTEERFAFQFSQKLWEKNPMIEATLFDLVDLYNLTVSSLDDVYGNLPLWKQYNITKGYLNELHQYKGSNQVMCQVVGVNWASNLCFAQVLHGRFHGQVTVIPFHNINMKVYRGEKFKTLSLGQLILAQGGNYDQAAQKHTGPGVFQNGDVLIAFNCRKISYKTKQHSLDYLSFYLQSKGLSAPQQSSLSDETWWDDDNFKLKPRVK